MLDWDDLRSFLAITRHGSLSAAARALGVQQTTMGRRLAALEARIGARLLIRTPAGYVPTPAGEAVLGNVERIEAETLAIERRIAGKDIRLEGTVRLTAVETFAVEILMPLLGGFRALHPGIEIELIADFRTLSLERREADVAVRMARPTGPDLAVRKIGRLGLGLYAAAAYLARCGMPDFAAGAAGQFVVLNPPEMMTRPDIAWLAAIAPRARPALRTASRYAQRAAAEAGIGIACLPRYLTEGRALVAIDPPSPPPEGEIWLAVHADIRHTPRIRALSDFLVQGLQNRSGQGPARSVGPAPSEPSGEAQDAPPRADR